MHVKKEERLSLQFHEKKYETNYIVAGEASIFKGVHVSKGSSEAEALALFMRIKKSQMNHSVKSLGHFWDIKPFEIHRITSIKNLISYEASTPELEDVIRIEDDTKRQSGHLKQEHS